MESSMEKIRKGEYSYKGYVIVNDAPKSYSIFEKGSFRCINKDTPITKKSEAKAYIDNREKNSK